MLRTRRHARMLLVAIAAMATLVGPSGSAAMQLPPPTGQWLVVYDFQDSNMARSLIGTFDIDGQFLRYRSLNRQLTWDVNLRDVDSIRLEDIRGPAIVVSGIVIDSFEGGKRIGRRIATVDEEVRFTTPLVLAGLMEHRLEQFRVTLARQ